MAKVRVCKYVPTPNKHRYTKYLFGLVLKSKLALYARYRRNSLLQGCPLFFDRRVFKSKCTQLRWWWWWRRKDCSYTRVLQKMTFTMNIFVFLISNCNKNSYLTFPFFRYISIQSAPYLTMSELFHFLLTAVRLLCYQPECKKCFHPAKIFKFVVAEILFLLYEIVVSIGTRLQPFAGFCKVFYLSIDTLLYILYK